MTIPKPLVQANQTFIVVTAVAALVFHSAILLLPFVVGAYTLITKKNPVIQLGRLFLKKPMASYQQEDKDQQLFNQWIATVSLGLSLIFFSLGMPLLGFTFSIMVIIAACVALMGYCIGCTIRYRYMMWKHNRTKVQA